MYGIWRTILLALLANGLLAAVALARPVYLADGGVVQAQKVWQEDGRIYVLLNRDSLISFSPEEIDLKKTFPKKQAPALRKPVPKRNPAAVTSVPVAASETAAQSMTPPQQAAAKPAPAAPPPTAASATIVAPTTQPKAASAPAAKTAPVATAVQPPATTPRPATSPQSAVQTPAKEAAAPGAPAAAAKPSTPTTPAKSATPPKPPAPPKPAAKKTPPPTPAVAPQLVGGGSVAALAMLGGILAFFLMLLAALWKVFVKAGQAGWKSLVPIYNFVVMLEIAGCPWWWFLMVLIPVVNLWFLVVMHIRLAQKFGKGPLFGFGLCFLGFIFFPILAFGSATYEQHEDTFTFDENFDEEGL